jgi:hypothetical protein
LIYSDCELPSNERADFACGKNLLARNRLRDKFQTERPRQKTGRPSEKPGVPPSDGDGKRMLPTNKTVGTMRVERTQPVGGGPVAEQFQVGENSA